MFQHPASCIRAHKQEAELLSFVRVEKKKTCCFERTFSSLQQNQGVISQSVESKAGHRQGFVHVAPQSCREHVRLRRHSEVVATRWDGPVNAPGDRRSGVGVNWTATRHLQLLFYAGGGDSADDRFIWRREKMDFFVYPLLIILFVL